MKRFGRPQCPYCGKKVGILNTWTLKKRGEYTCPRCQGLSNVVLDIFVPLFAAIAIVVALFSFIVNRVGEYPITLATFLWILGPFLVFYIVSLFLVHLRRPVLHRTEKPERKEENVKVYRPHTDAQRMAERAKVKQEQEKEGNKNMASQAPTGPQNRHTPKI